ncbi:LytTR family transcriptional regulator DNA-binding domain-containing protein [Rheinheimera sp. YQF-2]|uniref:LytTR family transcriptional regulator DNA-binding domain-containing protein n=1 Tax=Rheinheimera lutimaris TaxID=2740584 RepID=A0A7Y5ANI7_9GAMM|nr:LytTR family transcriptional regulator DNA-binding domain-containing protein [Rheinheimera lutimaris]
MGVTSDNITRLLLRFDRQPVLYSYLLLALYFFINAAINASSVWMEHSRDGSSNLQLWEPIVWEYSSAISTLLLFPLLFWWFNRYPLQLCTIRRQLLAHLLGSLLFSVLHVGLMVALRELIYHWQGGNYNFGPLVREFFYEYRKDAWGYVSFLIGYQLVLFVYSRIKGEAHQLDSAEDSGTMPLAKAPEHFLVKKLDKEFLIRTDDIEWLEASGNYVNLHSKGRIYPLRATLSNTLLQLSSKGFSRIHRSLAVNHNAIDSISYDSSGDGDILLKNGRQLALSRRYKDAFRSALQPD